MKQKLLIKVDAEKGIVTELRFNDDTDHMNWLISPETLTRYGYSGSEDFLFGKSVIDTGNRIIDTGAMKPVSANFDENSITFSYEAEGLEVCHKFSIGDDKLYWFIRINNRSELPITIRKMYHWLPVAYIMHETIEENYSQSCSFVPSIAGSRSYIICKKRSGKGPNLLIINNSGEMKSAGSLCKYKNLFFEKSAPSLSGLVLHNVVNAYKSTEAEANACVDWQYRDMYRNIILGPGEAFEDAYTFMSCPVGEENQLLTKSGIAVTEYPPIVLCGQAARLKVNYSSPVTGYKVFAADGSGEYLELRNFESVSSNGVVEITAGPFDKPGERKLVIYFKDGTHTFVVFTVYQSMTGMVEAFCHGIFSERFIDDPESPDYCGYRSTSRQGEACAKGSLLLLKNLVTTPVAEEVRQVEKNCVHYLRKRWLDENFIAIKQYPGGFARIIDMDYLILEFYLLSLFDDRLLQINDSETYLIWAYRTAAYRMEVTPDKLQREAVETELASMISWLKIEMMQRLVQKGYEKEADHLETLWRRQIEKQLQKVKDKTFVETEHYFDNAGISVVSETLLNAGEIKAGMEAVQLLLHNVADTNDYRSFAPDRWWEALGFMYHNLWAVFCAKAMLTAYEKSRDNRYLFSAYRSMMPMFYNYDWNVVSALNRIRAGEGVSAYCITSPNLNLEFASHNRFGQSVFKDDFFTEMDISGDDWDLGADMVVYLYTFGQKTYVTLQEGCPVCVNGDLTGDLSEMYIRSFAAYPSQYFIEPLDMTILRGSCDYTIKAITIKNNECVMAEIEFWNEECEVEIFCIKGSVREKINPQLIKSRRNTGNPEETPKEEISA